MTAFPDHLLSDEHLTSVGEIVTNALQPILSLVAFESLTGRIDDDAAEATLQESLKRLLGTYCAGLAVGLVDDPSHDDSPIPAAYTISLYDITAPLVAKELERMLDLQKDAIMEEIDKRTGQ